MFNAVGNFLQGLRTYSTTERDELIDFGPPAPPPQGKIWCLGLDDKFFLVDIEPVRA